MKFRKRHREETAEVFTDSLNDILFILLMFFLIVATLANPNVVEILVGLLIMRIGKSALDKILPPIVTGSMAVVIGLALAGAALGMASGNWLVAFVTLIATVLCSVFLQNKGLLGMLPILSCAIALIRRPARSTS